MKPSLLLYKMLRKHYSQFCEHTCTSPLKNMTLVAAGFNCPQNMISFFLSRSPSTLRRRCVWHSFQQVFSMALIKFEVNGIYHIPSNKWCTCPFLIIVNFNNLHRITIELCIYHRTLLISIIYHGFQCSQVVYKLILIYFYGCNVGVY